MSRFYYNILVYGFGGAISGIFGITAWQILIFGMYITLAETLSVFLCQEEMLEKRLGEVMNTPECTNLAQYGKELERKARLYDAVKRRAYITFNEAAHRTNAGGSLEKFVIQFPVCVECNDRGCYCEKHQNSEASQNLDDAIEEWLKSNS